MTNVQFEETMKSANHLRIKLALEVGTRWDALVRTTQRTGTKRAAPVLVGTARRRDKIWW